MATNDAPDLLPKVESFVRQYMTKYDASHDFHHIERVLALAKHIHAKEAARNQDEGALDTNLIHLGALMHDVGDRKYIKPGENVTTLVKDTLLALGASEQTATAVQDIVSHVSYSTETKDPEGVRAAIARRPELAIVQDADRLDCIGAVGIGRCWA